MTEPQIPIYHSAGMRRRTFLKTLGIASGSLMLAGLPQPAGPDRPGRLLALPIKSA